MGLAQERRFGALMNDTCERHPNCLFQGGCDCKREAMRNRPTNHAADGWMGPDVVMDPDPVIEPLFNSCCVCQGVIGWVECPTGGWWAHEQHPADDHDAEPTDA